MRTALLLAAAAVALSACERAERTGAGGGVGGICKPFASTAAAAPTGSGPEAVDDCLHRWGYTLARSNDDAESVAQAVMAACMAPLARWNQQGMAGPTGGAPTEAPSLLTGEPTNAIGAHAAFAEGRALFYVVQARAGKCGPPRVDAKAGAATYSPDR